MRTLAMTAGADNTLIWIIRINMDDGTYLYFADSEIVLSGITFSGKIISYGSMSEMGSMIDVLGGGSIGSVDHFSFAISRYTVYNDGVNSLQAFFNDWYPATSKPILTSKEIDLGLVWSNATTTGEITWLKNYLVSDYSYDTGNAYINCIEPDELKGKLVPYYKVQEDSDDGISYTTEATEEMIEKVIPIVYGDFSASIPAYETFNNVPALLISKNNEYKVTSHVCKSVNASVGYYLKNVKNMMLMTSAGLTLPNTRAGLEINFALTYGRSFSGNLVFHPQAFTGSTIGGTDYKNCLDDDSSNYVDLAAGAVIGFKPNAQLTTDKIGSNTLASADADFSISWSAPSGTGQILITAIAGALTLSTSDTASDTIQRIKKLEAGTKVIDEFDEFQLTIQNAGADTVRLYNVLVEFPNQIVFSKPPLILAPYYRDINNITSAVGNIKYALENAWQKITNQNLDVYSSELFVGLQGYMYDNWIDL